MKPITPFSPAGRARRRQPATAWLLAILVLAVSLLMQACTPVMQWLGRTSAAGTPSPTDLASVILGPLYDGQDLTVHMDEAGGFTVTYPAAWSARPGQEGNQSFIRIFGPDGQSSVYINSADAGDSMPFDSISAEEFEKRIGVTAESLLAVFGEGYSPEDDLESAVEEIGGKPFIRAAFHGKFPESGKRCAITAWMGIYNGRLYLFNMVHPADIPETDAALLHAVATSLVFMAPAGAATPSPAPSQGGSATNYRDDTNFFVLPNPAGWAVDRKDYPGAEMDLRIMASDGKSYLSVFTGPMNKQDVDYASCTEDELRGIAEAYFAGFDENVSQLYVVEEDRKIDIHQAEGMAYIKADFYVTEQATGLKGVVSMRRTVANNRAYLVSVFIFDTCSGDDFATLLDAFEGFRVTQPRR